jgi:hypothetical protein
MLALLSRIPISVWFTISIVLCYATWNPTEYSVVGFIRSDASLSAKAIVFIIWGAVVVLYAHEVWRNIKGVFVAGLLLAACLWFAFDMGATLAWAEWWGQILLGILLTIGFQGGRMYRAATGRVPVDGDVVEN